MKKFSLVTLGCRTNQYETQGYRDQLLAMGYAEAGEGEKADLCIVNTCTVTASADSSSRHHIRRLKRENPEAKIIVTGCLVDNLKEKIGEIDHLVVNKDKENLLKIVFPENEWPEFSIKNFEGHTRAFVKVQDGCNSFCSYCIIPYVRGRSKSRTIPEVLKEVRDLVSNGYQEVVITGINVGDFDGQGGKTLAELVREVDQVEGLKRLRLSSIDPDEVGDDLLSAIIEGKNTCPSMHIVLQSGSNVILTKMRRKYTRQCFLDTVERLKKAKAGFSFTTDVIVGFPGETERDFEETMEVISEVQFAKVHMFPYSRRERTKAYFFADHIPHEVILERKQRLLRHCEKVSFEMRHKYIGQKASVLVESGNFGYTDNFLPVNIIGKNVSRNQIVDVELVENTPEGLVGK